MALLLRRCRTLASPRLSRLSSSSSDGGGEIDKNPPPPPPPPSYSSNLSKVKASLRQPPPRKPPASRSPVQLSPLSPKPSKIACLEEIGKNLSEIRRRSAAPSQSTAQGSSTPPPVSFCGIHNGKIIGKPAAAIVPQKTSFDSIREILRKLNRSSNPPSQMNRSRRSETLEPLFSESLPKHERWLEPEDDLRDRLAELRKSSDDSSKKSSTFTEGSSSNGPKKEEATQISPEN